MFLKISDEITVIASHIENRTLFINSVFIKRISDNPPPHKKPPMRLLDFPIRLVERCFHNEFYFLPLTIQPFLFGGVEMVTFLKPEFRRRSFASVSEK